MVLWGAQTQDQLRTGGIHHVYTGHLHSYLQLGVFAESDMAHLYELTVRQTV